MRKSIITFLILVVGQTGLTQIDTTKILNDALKYGDLMASSFHGGDYDTFLDLTHPKIISLSGGRAKMKKMFKDGLGPGVEFLSAELTITNGLVCVPEIG